MYLANARFAAFDAFQRARGLMINIGKFKAFAKNVDVAYLAACTSSVSSLLSPAKFLIITYFCKDLVTYTRLLEKYCCRWDFA